MPMTPFIGFTWRILPLSPMKPRGVPEGYCRISNIGLWRSAAMETGSILLR